MGGFKTALGFGCVPAEGSLFPRFRHRSPQWLPEPPPASVDYRNQIGPTSSRCARSLIWGDPILAPGRLAIPVKPARPQILKLPIDGELAAIFIYRYAMRAYGAHPRVSSCPSFGGSGGIAARPQSLR